MSNPTPILNNINAFDATKGTTISFNIIGGTDIVRSNIVYIYDLSTNDLICTHLYISTESIHELPPNTDSSIVYASGKSSADFVNNKNYYLQIQTFTNTAGTAGGSGMSVAKTFWCLSNPSLSVNTIPAAISTTSYNVGATYNTNVTDTSIPVTNIIQQYKFDLYTATGTLVQTSGNIIGSGEQEGTSTTYNITYNFSGLVVNNSYYVVVTTTSTEGMTVSAQSNTFTVSIETPTVGGAIVNNNACDGYISVVSNLSDEYGGSASGEIASFETDSINNVSSLKVNMEPIQDLHGYDHPWVGGAGKNKLMPVLNNNASSLSANGCTLTVQDQAFKLTGTATGSGGRTTLRSALFKLKAGTYKASSTSTDVPMYIHDSTGTLISPAGVIVGTFPPVTLNEETDVFVGFNVLTGTTYNEVIQVQIEEGTTATAWTPYENICPINGRDSVSANVVGKNLFDKDSYDSIQAYFGNDSITYNASHTCIYMDCEPNTTYTASRERTTTNERFGIAWSKEVPTNGTPIFGRSIAPSSGTVGSTEIVSTTTGADAKYVVIWAWWSGSDVAQAKDTLQLELGSTATAYEPYQGQTYTTNLNQTVYGGTLDLATGVLTVNKAMVTISGDMSSWATPTGDWIGAFYALVGMEIGRIYGLQSNRFPSKAEAVTVSWNFYAVNGYLYFCLEKSVVGDSIANINQWVASNPIEVIYPLAQPQTYQLTPHQIQTLVGQNNIWSNAGNVEVTFNLPITNLLVKRQDTSDTSGKWLTLYSQPITQASDMDFTYIDFLNQHGKTYRYALVPLLAQQQGDVDVEIEGGYTVSDDVLSVFDGVFIANSNGSQKLKAATEYGDLETNQDVGVLTTIGGKYPFVVSNSNLNYHSGSISALIVPSDFYVDGDLDRLDIVERREAIEQFLTDKTAKILKDWNGNIWLITFVDNVEVSFVDDYGMGLGTLSAKWVEIGDVNDQTDLQQTGLI